MQQQIEQPSYFSVVIHIRAASEEEAINKIGHWIPTDKKNVSPGEAPSTFEVSIDIPYAPVRPFDEGDIIGEQFRRIISFYQHHVPNGKVTGSDAASPRGSKCTISTDDQNAEVFFVSIMPYFPDNTW